MNKNQIYNNKLALVIEISAQSSCIKKSHSIRMAFNVC
jgi:hypothetical protein